MRGSRMSGLIVLACAASATAQMVEDFEHGNIGLYTQAAGMPNAAIVAAAAHDGALGAQFSLVPGNAWYYRTDTATSPGNTYFAYVRMNGAAGGRLYLGFGASALGTWSAVAAPNTSQLILQTNTGFGFADSSVVPYAGWAAGTWYRLGVEWDASGTMKAKLWDESGATLLAETAAVPTTTTTGGVAMRAFNTAGTWDLDSIQALGGACYPDCNEDGALTVADFGCFQTRFVGGDMYADCNADSALTVADFGCFQTKFVAGCP